MSNDTTTLRQLVEAIRPLLSAYRHTSEGFISEDQIQRAWGAYDNARLVLGLPREDHPPLEPARDFIKELSELTFQLGRSRPVWRNFNTGAEIIVLDLVVDENGGFKGGCRRFAVDVIPQKAETYRPPLERRLSIDALFRYWAPTGDHVKVEDLPVRRAA